MGRPSAALRWQFHDSLHVCVCVCVCVCVLLLLCCCVGEQRAAGFEAAFGCRLQPKAGQRLGMSHLLNPSDPTNPEPAVWEKLSDARTQMREFFDDHFFDAIIRTASAVDGSAAKPSSDGGNHVAVRGRVVILGFVRGAGIMMRRLMERFRALGHSTDAHIADNIVILALPWSDPSSLAIDRAQVDKLMAGAASPADEMAKKCITREAAQAQLLCRAYTTLYRQLVLALLPGRPASTSVVASTADASHGAGAGPGAGAGAGSGAKNLSDTEHAGAGGVGDYGKGDDVGAEVEALREREDAVTLRHAQVVSLQCELDKVAAEVRHREAQLDVRQAELDQRESAIHKRDEEAVRAQEAIARAETEIARRQAAVAQKEALLKLEQEKWEQQLQQQQHHHNQEHRDHGGDGAAVAGSGSGAGAGGVSPAALRSALEAYDAFVTHKVLGLSVLRTANAARGRKELVATIRQCLRSCLDEYLAQPSDPRYASARGSARRSASPRADAGPRKSSSTSRRTEDRRSPSVIHVPPEDTTLCEYCGQAGHAMVSRRNRNISCPTLLRIPRRCLTPKNFTLGGKGRKRLPENWVAWWGDNRSTGVDAYRLAAELARHDYYYSGSE